MDEFDSAADYDAEDADIDAQDQDAAHDPETDRDVGRNRKANARSHHSVRLAMALTPTQRVVLQAMAEGRTAPQAAKRAGVDRSTVNRWKQRDAKFIAAYNAWMRETIEDGHSAVLSLVAAAVEAVRESIETGNGWLALQVLQGLGLMKPKQPGPTTPRQVRRQMRTTHRQRQVDGTKREAEAMLQRQEVERLEEDAERFQRQQRQKKEEYHEMMEDWIAYLDANKKLRGKGKEPWEKHNEQLEKDREEQRQKQRRREEYRQQSQKKWNEYFQDEQQQTVPQTERDEAQDWKPAEQPATPVEMTSQFGTAEQEHPAAPKESAPRQEPAVDVSRNPDRPAAAPSDAIRIAPHASPDAPQVSAEAGGEPAARAPKTTSAPTAFAAADPTPARPGESASKLNPDSAPPRDDRHKSPATATESSSGIGQFDATPTDSPPIDEDE